MTTAAANMSAEDVSDEAFVDSVLADVSMSVIHDMSKPSHVLAPHLRATPHRGGLGDDSGVSAPATSPLRTQPRPRQSKPLLRSPSAVQPRATSRRLFTPQRRVHGSPVRGLGSATPSRTKWGGAAPRGLSGSRSLAHLPRRQHDATQQPPHGGSSSSRARRGSARRRRRQARSASAARRRRHSFDTLDAGGVPALGLDVDSDLELHSSFAGDGARVPAVSASFAGSGSRVGAGMGTFPMEGAAHSGVASQGLNETQLASPAARLSLRRKDRLLKQTEARLKRQMGECAWRRTGGAVGV